MALTRASSLVRRRGEHVNVYRRTDAGTTDEYNRPEYTWALKYSYSILSYWDRLKANEVIMLAGERVLADWRVFFEGDEDVLKDDHVIRDSIRYEIMAIQNKRERTNSQFQVAYVKRLVIT